MGAEARLVVYGGRGREREKESLGLMKGFHAKLVGVTMVPWCSRK